MSKQYYLAFDAACLKCRNIAESVQKISNGLIKTESIYSERINTWIYNYFKNPNLEPILFEIEDGQDLKAYTGIQMSLQLLKLVGLEKSIKIISIIGKVNQKEALKIDASKRSFIRYFITGLGASVLLPFFAKIPLESVIAATPDYKLILGNKADRFLLINKANNNTKYKQTKKSLLSQGCKLQGKDYVIALVSNGSKVFKNWVQVFKTTDNKTKILNFTIGKNNNIVRVIDFANGKIIGITKFDIHNHIVYEAASEKSKSPDPKLNELGCSVCKITVIGCQLWCAVPVLAAASCDLVCESLGGTITCPAICNEIIGIGCAACKTPGSSDIICFPFCSI